MCPRLAGQELLDGIEELVAVSHPRRMNFTGKLYQLRSGNMVREITGMLYVDQTVSGSMHNKSWYPRGGKHMP